MEVKCKNTFANFYVPPHPQIVHVSTIAEANISKLVLISTWKSIRVSEKETVKAAVRFPTRTGASYISLLAP